MNYSFIRPVSSKEFPVYSAEHTNSIICFSHLRWDFVTQRPQHLMSQFAQKRPVLYWEEPIFRDEPEAILEMKACPRSGVIVALPKLPRAASAQEHKILLKGLLDDYLVGQEQRPIFWYYTPMMLPFSRHVAASSRIYDCMDELANFKFAPPELVTLEKELLELADVVFTGGHSLYEAKRGDHGNIHPMPSSVDRVHFQGARTPQPVPCDLVDTPTPRLGFYGVIDERMDLHLIAAVADARPDWTFVFIGPVVKIDPADLPQRTNIIYLGAKPYDELPSYLASWDVALMPFAINASTQFISPTKTPEYLAAGRPVVSTPICDVVRGYAGQDGVLIAETPEQFSAACEKALELSRAGGEWLNQADLLLSEQSWSMTFNRMDQLIRDVVVKHCERLPEEGGADDTPAPAAARRADDFEAMPASAAGPA